MNVVIQHQTKITSMGKIACLPYITSYGVHLVALLMDVFNANMIPGKISFHWFCGTSKSSSNDRNNSLIVRMLRSAKPLPSLWYPEVLRFFILNLLQIFLIISRLHWRLDHLIYKEDNHDE